MTLGEGACAMVTLAALDGRLSPFALMAVTV
jgi:hypothetical protein